jgi:hypothetical protein
MPSRRARSGLRASSAVRSNGPPSATEIFLTDNQARDHLTKAELALDKDGKFLAMRVATLRPGNPNLVLWHLAPGRGGATFFGATALLASINSGMAARACTVRIHSHIAIFAFFPRRSPPYRPLSEIT